MFLGQMAIRLSRRIDMMLCAWSTELGKGKDGLSGTYWLPAIFLGKTIAHAASTW